MRTPSAHSLRPALLALLALLAALVAAFALLGSSPSTAQAACTPQSFTDCDVPPCTSQASCQAAFQEFFGVPFPGSSGGEEPPAGEDPPEGEGPPSGGGAPSGPPCDSQKSCTALFAAQFGCDSPESCQAKYFGGGKKEEEKKPAPASSSSPQRPSGSTTSGSSAGAPAQAKPAKAKPVRVNRARVKLSLRCHRKAGTVLLMGPDRPKVAAVAFYQGRRALTVDRTAPFRARLTAGGRIARAEVLFADGVRRSVTLKLSRCTR